MIDWNKEREAFEQHLIDTGLVEFAGYGFEVDECDEYTHEPTNVAWATWIIGLNRVKAQAVLENHLLIPIITEQEIDEAISNGESFYRIRRRFEKAILERALIKTRGSQTEAAKMLGISRTGLGGILKRVSR
ncbi:HTH DNA binding protein [Acinetobacter phage vB_AbaM_fThrA]|nr:HTH DNA binding protein [Acinetobacter phage vB_AbaM_fThrA]